jgi:Zn finger protein HypA/HybF involved in hydrogenase expression
MIGLLPLCRTISQKRSKLITNGGNKIMKNNPTDECTECRWKGTEEDKEKLYDTKESNRLDCDVHTLVCPNCGNDEFYILA